MSDQLTLDGDEGGTANGGAPQYGLTMPHSPWKTGREMAEFANAARASGERMGLKPGDPCMLAPLPSPESLRPPRARTTDPETSKQAATEPRMVGRRGTHLRDLLIAYRELGAMTAVIAGSETGHPTAHKRVSELHRWGYLQETGRKAINPSGSPANMLMITPKGREALLARERKEAS